MPALEASGCTLGRLDLSATKVNGPSRDSIDPEKAQPTPPLYLGDKIRGRSDRAEKLPPLLSIDCTSLPAGCIRHREVADEIGCRPEGEDRYLKEGEMPLIEISAGSFLLQASSHPPFRENARGQVQ
jgi:hypothetical protein